MQQQNFDANSSDEEQSIKIQPKVDIEQLLNKYKSMRAEYNDDQVSNEEDEPIIINNYDEQSNSNTQKKDLSCDFEIAQVQQDESDEYILTQDQTNPIQLDANAYQKFDIRQQIKHSWEDLKPQLPSITKQNQQTKLRKFIFISTDISIHGIKYEQISYQIESYISQGLNDEYSEDKILVNRTYSDFEWLQNELVENFPGIIVPSIPARKILAKLNISSLTSSIRAQRQKGLEEFLNKLLSHPKLKNCDIIDKFFTCADLEFKRICLEYQNDKQQQFSQFIKTQTTGGLIGESLQTNLSKGLFVFKNYIFGESKENIKDKLQSIEEFFTYVEREIKIQSIKVRRIKESFEQIQIKLQEQIKQQQSISSLFSDLQNDLNNESQMELIQESEHQAMIIKEFSNKNTYDVIYVLELPKQYKYIQKILLTKTTNSNQFQIQKKQELQSLIAYEANALSTNKFSEETKAQIMRQLNYHQESLGKLIDNFKIEFEYFCDRFNKIMNESILNNKKYLVEANEQTFQLWNYNQ